YGGVSMARTWKSLTFAVVLSFGAVVAAQQAPEPSPTTRQPAAQSQTEAKTMITGCVAREGAAAGATGTAGTTGAAAGGSQYRLTNAMLSSSASSSTTTGT